ncbi:amidohydrolase family protein [Caballeronia sp. dw_19]|uniref:amidohydrolase family protein n=1 Tax=Caballeronia sp. dw_19 TaxID=2719791 RepID=UPI001BD3228B|nr:amidohydrolase family protein [Caballeronia sp. dw_19]
MAKGSSVEAILDQDLLIVDPHHHLWGAPHPVYRVQEFARDLGSGHRVAATVHVECSQAYREGGPSLLQPVGETEHIASLTAKDICESLAMPGLCAGIVGFADFRVGAAVREVLHAHIAAAEGRFRGIRHTAPSDTSPEVAEVLRIKPPGLLLDRWFREGFAELAPLQLSFDAWVCHTQLDDVTNLARAFPDTTIILNHTGGPVGIGAYAGKRDAVFAVWSAGIQTLAREPNVLVKLGGLGMKLGGFGFEHQPVLPGSVALAKAWQPYIETCIQAFGPARCMFESNFPVDGLSCSYATLWNAFKRLAAGYGDKERRDLFSGTALRAYRIRLDG